MPYRRPYRPRPYRRRRTVPRKKTVYSNARRVRSLERRVSTLAKHDKTWGTYKRSASLSLGQPYYTVNLMDPAHWSAIFGNPTNVENTDNFHFNSITTNLSIVPNNEAGLIDITVFLVSARKANARKVLQETSGATNLSPTLDYCQDAYGTGTVLNLDRWKIHASRKCFTRITMGTQEPAIPTPTRRMTFRTSWKVPLKSATGNWKNTITSVDDINAHSQLFLIIFNNNSTLNLASPIAYFNTLYSGYTLT